MPQLSKRAVIFIVLLVTVVLCGFAAVYYVYLSPTGLRARESSDLAKTVSEVPARYTDIDGNAIDLREYDSKVLLVNVWASWSPFTSQDHEVLSTLKDEFGDAITIRAVNRMESKETAVAYLETIGRRDGIEYVMDTTDHLYVTQGGYAMPETLIFDEVGNLKGHIRGLLNLDQTKAQIKAILES